MNISHKLLKNFSHKYMKIECKEDFLKVILIIDSHGYNTKILYNYYEGKHYKVYLYRFDLGFSAYIGSERVLLESKLSEYLIKDFLKEY